MLFKVSLLFKSHVSAFFSKGLSPGMIDTICRTIAVVLGSNLSPASALFKETLSPWLDMQALSQPDQALIAMLAFYQQLQTHREIIIEETLPQLFLCLVLSLGFLYVCNQIGHHAAKYLIKRYFSNLLPA